MQKFGKGQPAKRLEDVRFLTGAGRYIDDIAPDGALHALFLRAPVAHGEITRLDLDDARAIAGVRAVITADDLIAAGVRIGMSADRIKNRDGSRGHHPERPILARGRVRYLGEAVAMVVAEDLQTARDAIEAIGIDVDPLPAHVATEAGGPQIHAGVPDNIAFDFAHGNEEATRAAIARAAHVVRLRVPDHRVIVNAIEPRGAWAEPMGDRLHLCVNGQGVWGTKTAVARHLGMPAEDLRVTNPDVGGGFGMKGMLYPEQIAVAAAARMLGAPVRWIADRTESMLSDNHGRDLWSDVTLAFDAGLKLTGYMVESLSNLGAYNSQYAQMIQTELFSMVLTGTYDLQAAWLRCRGVFTNTTPVDAYRGAGRPEAIFVLEHAMDHAARVLGVDPWDLRRRSFIRPAQFPYRTLADVAYDVGDFERVLDRAAVLSDRAGLPARKAASAARGMLRGQGLCFYIESILGDPDETARIIFAEGDRVEIHVGTQSNGQGHETVYARFLSDQTGIPVGNIVVVQGDSDRIPRGGGTGGSRSVTVQNTATLAAVDKVRGAFAAFLAAAEGVDAADVGFDDERFRIPGSNHAPDMLEVARLARAAGRHDLLDQSATTVLPSRSFPYGAHVAEVEIDPETGAMTVERYTVVDDFGNLINPMLVEGQVHGGVAQGLGQAVCEVAAFDADGQLLTATFMDYAMPRADTMPPIVFATECTPSLYNPMGMKGCGEAGTVGALAAVTNAVQDAVWDRGIRQVAMPFTPQVLWGMLQEA